MVPSDEWMTMDVLEMENEFFKFHGKYLNKCSKVMEHLITILR